MCSWRVLFGQSYVFNHLTPENGLSTTTNYHIFQDSYNKVWISSLNGLNCFDGHQNTIFKSIPGDDCTLKDNNIQSGFQEDDYHNIWFSTYTSVEYFERKSGCFKHFFLKDSLKNAIAGYYFIGLDKKGGAWCIVQGQYIDILTGVFEKKGQVRPNTIGGKILLDKNGEAHLALTITLTKNDGLLINYLNGASKGQREDIFTGKKGQGGLFHFGEFEVQNNQVIWVSSKEGGLMWYNPMNKTYGAWEEKHVKKTELINGFTFEGEDKIWVGSKFIGLRLCNLYTGEILKEIHYNPSNTYGLSGDDISCIRKLKDGTIFISIKNIGIDYFQPEKIRFNSPFLLKNIHEKQHKLIVNSLTKDLDNKIWFVEFEKGIWQIDANQQNLKLLPKNKISDFTYQLFLDKSGKIWNLSWSGLGFWDAKFNQFSIIDTLPMLHGTQLTDETMLFTHYNGGISALTEKNNQSTIEPIKGFLPKSIYIFPYEDSKQRLWLSKEAEKLEVYEKKTGNWSLLKTLEIQGVISAYWENTVNNVLWCASSEGLIKINLEDFTFKKFVEKDGLPDASINSMLEDGLGFLWLGTNRGIVQFDLKTEKFRGFNRSDGLPGLNFQPFSAIKTSNGDFWFGCEKGITSFHPKDFALIDNQTKPIITKLLINDLYNKDLHCERTNATNVEQIQSLLLESDQKTISFEFVLPTFTEASKAIYRYQLVGVDADTVESGTRGFARYADLKPGSYTFLVWAANSDAIWSKEPAHIEIHLKPPFTQTIPFYLATILGLLFLFGLWFREYKGRKERIHQLKLDKAIAVEQERRRASEFELIALRAMINPHFFFNALNPLNAFILKSDRINATTYLAKFVSLMRKTLDHSERQTLPIIDELNYIENYIAIENERYAPKQFMYNLLIDKNINQYETHIPSMILQPFIENAIWHGIHHLPPGTGVLNLEIKKITDNQLHFILQDNGVGREKAAILREKQMPNHKSKGMDITKDRLEKLAVGNRIFFTDLKDENGNATGTKVEIFIRIAND
jgi:ligand-binding sensor domain-containing protein